MNKLKDAFGNIKAQDRLKKNTANFIHKEITKRKSKPIFRFFQIHRALPIMLILFVALGSFGSYSVYAKPVSYISIDVNPSIELALNRFDRVVAVTAYNKDGEIILNKLNLKNKSYTKAIDALLNTEALCGYLKDGDAPSFTIVSNKEEIIISGIKETYSYQKYGGDCHQANAQTMSDAHHADLSIGKYQAYLMLKKQDDTITLDHVRGMTMRQIKDVLDPDSSKKNGYRDGMNNPQNPSPNRSPGSDSPINGGHKGR